MNCKTFHIQIQDYIEGVLDDAARKAFETHLGSCGPCSAELASYRNVFTLLDELDTKAVPAGFEDRVIERLWSRQPLHARSEGVLNRIARAVSHVPVRVRYALGGIALALILWIPILALWTYSKQALGRSALEVTGVVVNINDAVQETGVIHHLIEVIQKDIRIMQFVITTLATQLWNTGQSLILPGAGILVIFLFMLFLLVRVSQRRSTRHVACYI